MRQWLTVTAGGLCLTLASSVHALGVGDPQQVSSLNRPLHVVLPLTDGAGLEPSQISVTVADDAAYRQSGLSRSALIDALSAKVVREEGGLSLVIDSPRRVREPFLDLLLVVTWPDGQWQRDVSLLFDPVGYASARPLLDGDRSPTQSHALSGGSESLATLGTPGQAHSVADSHGAVASTGPQPWPSRLTSHAGDSLSSLASSLLPRPDMSRQSLMVALFQSNPSAFVDNDPDRLRAGVDLNVPSIDAVTDMDRGDAVSALQALTRETQDGRPVIDIVGRDASSSVSDSSASPQIVALKQRLSTLTAETERQRATIDALRTERDTLQGALAAVGVPPLAAVTQDAGVTSASATEDDRASQFDSPTLSPAAMAAAASMTTQEATSAVPGKSVAGTGEHSPASPPTNSLWQRLVGHLDWIGAGLLVALLGLWGWQRRRQARREISRSIEETSSMAEMDPKAKASRQPTPLPASRRAAIDVDDDSASISQADIYMAYGRHAEARDWLRQQLAQSEDAQLRLGLLKALGELRDMDALEEALSGFGYDATSEQRREGRELADHYRARYVEESWQEATAEVVEERSDAAWVGDVENTDALFESQTVAKADDGPALPSEDPRLGETEAFDAQPDPKVALFDDELPSPDASGTSRLPSSIEYEAPTLDLSAGQSDQAAPSSSSNASSASEVSPSEASSSTAMPAIDFSAITLEPLAGDAVEVHEASAIHGGTKQVSATASSAGGENGDARAHSERDRGARLEVPAGWDVEEVEFQSSHRDNGRP